jgi:hypothetical protein
LPVRARAPFVIAAVLALVWSVFAIAPVAAAGKKVVIIVGPTGAMTDGYRAEGNRIANAAAAAGAEVVKVYSPRATWRRVQAAVEGANIIVYLGHGNGFPSPYSGTENTDRVNGWGLNRTTQNGDSDNWSTTMVYCGEKALLGTLTASDGAAQRQYCSGGLNPAPGFVMIYNRACYAPGAGEPWMNAASETEARLRVTNYSYPVLALGAGAYFATDMYQGGPQLVDTILRNPNMPFGRIAANANGYDAGAQRHFEHPDVAGAELWLQRTDDLGRKDYWFAFAGDPSRTPAGGSGTYVDAPRVTKVSPSDGSRFVSTSSSVQVYFNTTVLGLEPSGLALYDSFGFRVPADLRWTGTKLRATLDPSSTLVTREWYTLRLSGTAHSAWGVTLNALQWQFRTKDDGGDGVSARWANGRQLVLGQGTHTGYLLDANGAVTGHLTGTLAADALVMTDTVRRLPGQSGYWFHLTDGTWAGYWVRMSDVARLADAPAPAQPGTGAFDPPQVVTVRKGTHTGYQFDAAGAMTAEKTVTRSSSTTFEAAGMERVANQAGTWFRATSGTWAGYWLRASDVVLLLGG